MRTCKNGRGVNEMETATKNELNEMIEAWYEEPGMEGRMYASDLEQKRRLKHYGVWDDESGWWAGENEGLIFVVTSYAIAQAQVDIIVRSWPSIEGLRVRCIEEWADAIE